jgi:hypothetical protein
MWDVRIYAEFFGFRRDDGFFRKIQLGPFEMAEKLFGRVFFAHADLGVSRVDVHVVNNHVGLLFYQFL